MSRHNTHGCKRYLQPILLGIGLITLLGWGWYGWLQPDMVLSWETLMALCGFR